MSEDTDDDKDEEEDRALGSELLSLTLASRERDSSILLHVAPAIPD